jgi:hypothetical protein
MIAKGNLHAHGAKLAAYLTTGKEGERAELVELRGFAADNIRDAFTDVEIQSKATRSTKPFFHSYIRLPDGEVLTSEQWHLVADRIEKRLGFEDQPRAVAFHHGPDGESHMHIAWSRIDTSDPEQMRAIDPGLYKNKLKEVCRSLESDLDLTKVKNERDVDDKTRAAGRDEFEEARRLGTDLKDIRNTIRACWEQSDTGQAFAAALDQQGLILARGDKRDFVIVDHEGGQHALSKRITDATAAVTRARMADVDRASLPDIDAARELQAERLQQRGLPAEPEIHAQEQGRGLPAEPGIPAPEQSAAPASEPVATVHVVRESVEPAGHHHEGGFGEVFGIVLKAAISHFGGEAVIDAAVEHTAVLGPGVHEAAEAVAENIEPISTVHEVVEVAGELHGDKKPGPKRNTAEVAAAELARRGDRALPRMITTDQYLDDPGARQEYLAQQRAARASEAALLRMRNDMEAGHGIQPEDVRSLTHEHLANLQAKGDDYLRQIIADREKEQEQSFGRERER